MIGVVVMQPFDAANNAFKLEAEALRNPAAADVGAGALDGDAVQFKRLEGVRDVSARQAAVMIPRPWWASSSQ